jgi:hypothetical protein
MPKWKVWAARKLLTLLLLFGVLAYGLLFGLFHARQSNVTHSARGSSRPVIVAQKAQPTKAARPTSATPITLKSVRAPIPFTAPFLVRSNLSEQGKLSTVALQGWVAAVGGSTQWAESWRKLVKSVDDADENTTAQRTVGIPSSSSVDLYLSEKLSLPVFDDPLRCLEELVVPLWHFCNHRRCFCHLRSNATLGSLCNSLLTIAVLIGEDEADGRCTATGIQTLFVGPKDEFTKFQKRLNPSSVPALLLETSSSSKTINRFYDIEIATELEDAKKQLLPSRFPAPHGGISSPVAALLPSTLFDSKLRQQFQSLFEESFQTPLRVFDDPSLLSAESFNISLLDIVSRTHVLFVPYSPTCVAACLLGRNTTEQMAPRVLVILGVPGLKLRDQLRIERALALCWPQSSAKPPFHVLWTRSDADSRAGAPADRIQIPKKDLIELFVELGLLLKWEAPSTSRHPRTRSYLDWGIFPAVEDGSLLSLATRTRYDPDLFAYFGTSSISAKSLLLRVPASGVKLYNMTNRSADQQNPHRGVEVTEADFVSAGEKGLGPLGKVRVGYLVENSNRFRDLKFSLRPQRERAPTLKDELNCTATRNPKEIIGIGIGMASPSSSCLLKVYYIHYPWVRDNLYHTHNDNILPLLLLQRRLTDALRKTIGPSIRLEHHVLLLPTSRSNPLPVFDLITQHIFHSVETLGPNESPSASNEKRGLLVFGRPMRPFAASLEVARVFQEYEIVGLLRRTMDRLLPPSDRGSPSATLRITLITRSKGRVLLNGELLWFLLNSIAPPCQGDSAGSPPSPCSALAVEVRRCCEGMSYIEQMELMRKTHILIGVHGAGLLHIINLDPTPVRFRAAQWKKTLRPLVLHIGSRRLNYHEQTIIERLTFLSKQNDSWPRFMTTVTFTDSGSGEAGAAWQDDFSIPAIDLLRTVEWMLVRFFSGL